MKKKPTITIQGKYELRDGIALTAVTDVVRRFRDELYELGIGDLTIRVSGGEYTV